MRTFSNALNLKSKILILGLNFPEPSTTAAGKRMIQLINLFRKHSYEIVFASAAAVGENSLNLEESGVETKEIKINDSSFDIYLKELNPDIVVFDRFITEEQFGWRVSKNCPKAIKILDTEDLHFLRKAREEAVKKKLSFSEEFLFSDTAKREIASIFRSDLSLIISEYEMHLLVDFFNIPESILMYLPFLLSDFKLPGDIAGFEERKDFMTIGNLLHAPNVDAVVQLRKIWPEIRENLPDSELHIFGNYAPQSILEMNSKKDGFLIKGPAEDLENVMKAYRVQLAPLRFGAGLKGKIVDAHFFGLPTVTTNIGAEGIRENNRFGGKIVDSLEDFSSVAIELYQNKKDWEDCQKSGLELIQKKFHQDDFEHLFFSRLSEIQRNPDEFRRKNFIGQMLLHHSMQSTKYMSRWIECKNRFKT